MSLASTEDGILIELFCKSNNKDAFAELYRRHMPMVLTVSLKYMKDQHLAEDMTQQVFERLMRRICDYQIDTFKSWLYQTTKNHCLMHLRKKDPLRYSQDVNQNLGAEPENPRKKQELEQNINNLELAIQGLKDKQKTCVELFYMQGLSYAQIEEKTGWNFNEIKSNLQNAKRNLKNILGS